MKSYNEIAASALREGNVVGNVSKLFGNGGEVVIKMWDCFPEDSKEPLWVEIDSLAVPLFLTSLKMQGSSKGVAIFEDFESVRLAEMLVGRTLYSLQVADSEDVDEDFEFLTGFTLLDLTSGRSFRVDGYVDCEFNPLLELEGDVLAPISEELIEKIDEKKKIITVRYAEGIFDL